MYTGTNSKLVSKDCVWMKAEIQTFPTLHRSSQAFITWRQSKTAQQWWKSCLVINRAQSGFDRGRESRSCKCNKLEYLSEHSRVLLCKAPLELCTCLTEHIRTGKGMRKLELQGNYCREGAALMSIVISFGFADRIEIENLISLQAFISKHPRNAKIINILQRAQL